MQNAAYADVIAWDERGLAPAVVQHATTGETLMVAWMNVEALRRTRETGLVHFFSRSRQALWQKGESSGNALRLCEIRTDCDRDAILVRAEPAGPTCHTGARSCFVRRLAGEGETEAGLEDDDGPGGVPSAVVDRVYGVLQARRDDANAPASYTASLLAKGFPKILDKIAEEHGELAEELPSGDRDKVVHETADLLFHVLVGLVARGIAPVEVWRELERRFGVSGHAEKAARAPAAAPSGG